MTIRLSIAIAAAATAITLSVAAPASASVTFYGASAAFAAAAPGLPTETFAGLAADFGTPPGGGTGLPNGINSTVYAGMVPGATYSATTTIDGMDVALIGPFFATGIFGSPPLDSYALFSNHFVAMLIDFGPGVSAASLDLYSLFSGSTATINVLDSSGLIGSLSLGAPNGGPGAFFGVTSTTGITELQVFASGATPGFTNVSFGGAGGVPEPATWGLMIAGFGLAGAALRARKASSLA